MIDEIEVLKAKVKAAQEANAKKVTEAALKASLKATLEFENSEDLFNSKVKLAVASQHSKRLKQIVDECEAIINNTPVMDSRKEENRKWSGVKRFPYGQHVNLMHQLVTGIMYSCAEHKYLLLEHTGLSPELIDQFVESFGSTAFYSKNLNRIEEAKPYNVNAALMSVRVMQSELDVVVDTNLLTEKSFKSEFDKAAIVAEKDKLKADEAIAMLDMAI